MPMSKELNQKLQQQYRSAEEQRRLLIHQLYKLIDDLEHRPVIRSYNPFPYGLMERGIQKVLDLVERKWLRKRWAKMLSQAKG